MRIRVGNYWLAGDPDFEPHEFTEAKGFRIDGSPEVQVSKAVRAASAVARHRGNTARRVTFQTSRLFASVDAADKFMLEHEEQVPTTGDVFFEAPGGTTRYMADAVVAVSSLASEGMTVLINYTITGGAMSTSGGPGR